MKVRLILIVAVAALVGGLASTQPAEAGHLDWSFGVGFHVGGLHFKVGFGPPAYGPYPGPFFVTSHRLHYRGYGCHDACFRRGPKFYHHAYCPLVGFHFRRGGYGPDYYLSHYAPYGTWGPRVYKRHYRYPNRAYGFYYRNGYRDRHYHPGGRYYRDRHHRGHRDRGRRYDHRHRGRRDYDHDSDSDSDSDRHYRNDRRNYRGRDGGRDYAEPRRGARRTRPPR